MSTKKQNKASVGEAHGGLEAPCPAANSQASAVGPEETVAASAKAPEAAGSEQPRLHSPDRRQLLSAMTIDEVLETDHPARLVWTYVEQMDLSSWYDRIRSRGRLAGRPATDPRLLVALWLYATLAGFTSAREIAELCRRHDAFRWLCGGVLVNYHTLSDFRTDNLELLQQLLNHSVEVLRRQGLLDLDRIAQDGMRVRASASAASFRRKETLERLLQEAQAEVLSLRQQLLRAKAKAAPPQEAAPTQEAASQQQTGSPVAPQAEVAEPVAPQAEAASPVQPQAEAAQKATPLVPQAAAAMRHAEERLERIERALKRMAEIQAKIKPEEKDKKQTRVSSTDPEATVMKMGDGGYRPAYNLEYATTCRDKVIVGVEVLTAGSDLGQLPGMLDQIDQRFGQRPKAALVDGRVASQEDIENVQGAKQKCLVYAPVDKPKKEGVDRHEPKKTDSAQVAEWRKRMGTDEAKQIYKQRGSTAELVNAHARNRGLQQFLVRGLDKVKAVALWFAITNNMARFFALLPQPG